MDRFKEAPYFQIISLLINLLNFKAIFSVLHDTVTNTDLGVLRVKSDDSDNPHCHRQELTLVTGTRGHYSFQE